MIADLRGRLIAAGCIRERARQPPSEVPPRTVHEGPKLRLDIWGHRAAAKRVADYHAHGPAWNDLDPTRYHELDALKEYCVRCGTINNGMLDGKVCNGS